MKETTCQVDDCESRAVCRGYCNPHYQRLYQYGNPLAGKRPVGAEPSAVCEVTDCDGATRSSFAKYCEKHYMRMRRRGSLEKLDRRKARPAYRTAHARLRTDRGAPTACELCNTTSTQIKYEWALKAEPTGTVLLDEKTGCAYSTDPHDYFAACKACHSQHDADLRRKRLNA